MKKILLLLIIFFATNSVNAQWHQTNVPYSSGTIACILPDGPNIFAGLNGSGIFLSTNIGNNWFIVDTTSHDVLSLAISGTTIFAGTSYGILKSTNYGASWSESYSSLNYIGVNSLVVSGSKIFAGSDNELYLSSNNGSS
jgi:photosystem II stability/assembly factor-like uncharacterized protein